jgi:hypothetical protein
MATLEKIEFKKISETRFIGKSVYARSGPQHSGYIFGGLWHNSGWIFEALDKLSEYATTEPDHIALMTWDKYDKVKSLMGYTVGRFMKPGTPAPEGMDFYDYPDMTVAAVSVKGTFDDCISSVCRIADEAIKNSPEYIRECELCKNDECDFCSFEAEVYYNMPDETDSYVMGYYIPVKRRS